jgi:hypothetical protein
MIIQKTIHEKEDACLVTDNIKHSKMQPIACIYGNYSTGRKESVKVFFVSLQQKR